MVGTHVQDITAAGFQKDVVERSLTTPVLLDFWAAWCGPCRTLGPVLEALAARYAGGFVLGKVDTEREQDLAYAFGVQGIPFVVLMRDGRPVDAFQGALPEAEVVAFLERNGIHAGADGDAAAEPAAVDPDSPMARYEQARMLTAAGDVAGARAALEGLPEEEDAYSAGQRLAAGFAWLEGVADAATEAGRHLAAARQHFLDRDYEGAMTEILASATADRGHRDGLARRAMLTCFAVVGEEDERLDDYRRRLATLLY